MYTKPLKQNAIHPWKPKERLCKFLPFTSTQINEHFDANFTQNINIFIRKFCLKHPKFKIALMVGKNERRLEKFPP